MPGSNQLLLSQQKYFYQNSKSFETAASQPRCMLYNITNMSHVKNAEAFTRVVNFCTGFGGIYNPGRPTLHIDALTVQVKQIHSALEAVKTAKANYDLQVNQRKQAFDRMPRVLAGILRMLESYGTKPEQLDDARAYVHQFIGTAPRSRTPVPSENAESAQGPKANLQLAFAARVETFSKLVAALKTEPLYLPQETAYQIPALETKVLELTQLNQSVDVARKEWRMQLIERNKFLYSNENSMMAIARAVKKYVRGLFGHNSGEYALLKELAITKPGNT